MVVVLTARIVGCVITTEAVAKHPLPSVTVKSCTPSQIAVMFGVVAKVGVHKNVYGPVPPVYTAFAVASHAPKQVTFVLVIVAINSNGSVIFAVVDAVHPFASVTVTV